MQRVIPSANPTPQARTGSARITVGRRPLNPHNTAARFIREFEEEYGASPLPFHNNGYAQALDVAKKDLRFLLVILLSPEHDDTSSFIRHTLLSREVVEYVTDPQNRILLWGGTVQDSEAYQVSAALNCTKFPFSALIAHTPQVSSTAMSVVARIVGPTPPAAWVTKLREAITQHSEILDRARAARASQEAERSLREQQNSAYERSLAQDRERARQKREAETERLRVEDEAKQRRESSRRQEQDLRQWKQWRAQNLSAEPESGTENTMRVSIRMPSGQRIIRRFASDDTVEEIYAHVECHDMLGEAPPGTLNPPRDYKHHYAFRLVSPMPRTVYEADADRSIGSCIKKNSNLVVEPLENEDDGEG